MKEILHKLSQSQLAINNLENIISGISTISTEIILRTSLPPINLHFVRTTFFLFACIQQNYLSLTNLRGKTRKSFRCVRLTKVSQYLATLDIVVAEDLFCEFYLAFNKAY